MAQQGAPSDVAIRLVYDGNGISLQPDRVREDDATLDHGGRVVLLPDSQVSDLLADHALDVEGDQLAIRPAAEGE
ncbi:MAG: hypothetical protein J5J06_00270 [Phycisphaerae bacterium]|nr:hypothetical protein [Phycisphaerae bacterium]